MFSRNCEFKLNDNEYDKIYEWYHSHECTLTERHGMPKYVGPIGGSISVTFTPTSIGDVIEVECACGAKFTVRELI